jgi:catechol 2,3-dioxygenase-like lactoylglutathione lyase family enzyme
MEQIIANLLEDFERGKMSRRQLIQSLAITTATAAIGAPALAAAPARSPFKAIAVNHISYNVADYGRTRDFYADLFDMKVSHDNGKQCFMEFGSTFLLPRNSRDGKQGYIDHMAYTIETWDKDQVEAELKRRGLDPRPDTPDSFHIKDPDGFDVQIAGPKLNPKNY